jgi:hypothetical protein
VGINQIRNVYMPAWTGGQEDFFERLHTMLFAQIRQQDCIGQYYLTLEGE